MRVYQARPIRQVAGDISVPGDKSISHRSMMLAGICEGTSRVHGFLPSEDCLASLRAMQALGVQLRMPAPDEVLVQGAGLRGLKSPGGDLDMGNAGTAMRLFAGLLAGQHFDSRLIGDPSLSRRPMERVAIPLRLMGARVSTTGGLPPILIGRVGRLSGIEYTMPMASAQVKSAVLLAGLYADSPTCVIEPAVSRDHSERMLESCGVRVQCRGGRVHLEPPSRLEAVDMHIPGDFSSAAFFIVAGLLGAGSGDLLIRNVGMNPTRTGLLDILRQMGADIRVLNQGVSGAEPVADLQIRRSALRGITVQPDLVPLAIDEFPVLFIAAACASGETRISNAAELRVKETDRIAVMAAGLAALGVEHEVYADGLSISGRDQGAAFTAGEIHSRGDHRIAMAFSVASLRSAGTIRVHDTANVATSFPGFVDLARSVGFDLDEIPGVD